MLASCPLASKAMSFANACMSAVILSLGSPSRPSITMFHKNGLKIHPCGEPLPSARFLVVSCKDTVVCLLVIMDIIHFLTVTDWHFLFNAFSIALKEMLSKALSISKKVPRAIFPPERVSSIFAINLCKAEILD